MNNRKEELMKKIQELAFAKTETELYLDMHPKCSMALSHYRNILDMLDEAMIEYQNKYGPIYHEGVVGDSWSWVEGEWPWQTGNEASGGNVKNVGV